MRRLLEWLAAIPQRPMGTPRLAVAARAPYKEDRKYRGAGDEQTWAEVTELIGAYPLISQQALAGHLHGLAALLDRQVDALLAPMPMVRVILETAALGWWPLDLDVDIETRIKRALFLRNTSLKNSKRALASVEGRALLARQQERHRRSLEVAAQAGLAVERRAGDDGEQVIVGLRDSNFSPTEIALEMLEAESLPLRAGMIELLSGVVHGYPAVLLSFRHDAVTPQAGQPGLIGLHAWPEIIEDCFWMAATAGIALGRRLLVYLGQSTRELDRAADEVRQLVLARGN